MEKVLKVKNLEVKRGEEKVISDLSFSVEKGEFLTILGPNGAGKSTLLKTLLGGIDFEGEIEWVRGAKINYLPERLGGEEFSAYPLTVADFFRLSGEKRKKGVLEEVGLDSSFWKRSPSSLSSGEFQRMLIGWALLGEPDVLLLDEPMGGIDAGGKESIYSLIQKVWRREKLTVLLVTHEINVVFAYSTNVLCLSRKKLCYGEPKEVLTPENLREIYGYKIKFYKHR